MKIKSIGILLQLLALVGCNSNNDRGELISRTKALTIYEVMPRHYSAKKNFNGIIEDLDRIQNLFFNTICLLPVQERDDANNAFNPGTPFAIKSFTKTDPVLGDAKDLNRLIDSVHARDMLIFIQWNFTITGPNHEWRVHNPGFYKSSEKKIGNQYNHEFIKLNLSNAKLQKELIAALKQFLRNHNFDGIVFYNLEELPYDFFTKVLKQVKDIRPMLTINYSDIFFPECDLNFNQNLFKKFLQMKDGNLKPVDFAGLLDSLSRFSQINYLLDYQKTEKYGNDAFAFENSYKYFHMLTYFLPGIPWVLNGQEFPQFFNINLFSPNPIHRGYAYHIDFYRKLNLMRVTNSAMWNLQTENLPKSISDSKDVLALERSSGDKTVVGLFNLQNNEVRFTLNKEYLNFFDALNKSQVSFPIGKEFALGPHQSIMIMNTPQ